MNEDDFLPFVVKRYEQEYQRHQNIDSKAYNIIGFVGVIVAVLGFVISDGLVNPYYLPVILFGICGLLGSIIISIIALFPKKKIPAFKVKKYLERMRRNGKTPPIINIYAVHGDRLHKYNTSKTMFVKFSFIALIIGLVISFIGIVLSIFPVVS